MTNGNNNCLNIILVNKELKALLLMSIESYCSVTIPIYDPTRTFSKSRFKTGIPSISRDLTLIRSGYGIRNDIVHVICISESQGVQRGREYH